MKNGIGTHRIFLKTNLFRFKIDLAEFYCISYLFQRLNYLYIRNYIPTHIMYIIMGSTFPNIVWNYCGIYIKMRLTTIKCNCKSSNIIYYSEAHDEGATVDIVIPTNCVWPGYCSGLHDYPWQITNISIIM